MRKTNAAPSTRIKQKVARLSETECSEVLEYIDIMQSLRREAARRDQFDERSARTRSVMGVNESSLTGQLKIPAY